MSIPLSEVDLITLHEAKMTEFQHLHQEIPVLEAAAREDPENQAIKARLKLCLDTTADVSYLAIGPHLILEYSQETNPEKRADIVRTYYREALKSSVPSNAVPPVTVVNKKRKLNSSARPSFHQSIPKSSNPHEDTGNCTSCGFKQSTFYSRTSGYRTCNNCGVAVLDNLSFNWQDASYKERVERNMAGHREYIEDRDPGDEDDPQATLPTDTEDNPLNPLTPTSKYKYECRSYLSFRLSSVQCKEHARISPEDLQKIYDTLHKHRHYNGVTGWTPKRMKDFLKICKLPKLYKHANYLLCFMSSKLPLRIDKEVEELFMDAFDRIEPLLNKYKPILSDHRTPSRKSRPHYGYICRQLSRILGQEELVEVSSKFSMRIIMVSDPSLSIFRS